MTHDNRQKRKVLLVDDDPLFLRYVSHFFTRNKYEVVTAANGEEGLEKARRLQPDVIVLDLDMPDLDGIETCKNLKADKVTHQIPVVILTAMEDWEVNQRGFSAGAHATVLKSMSRDRLLNIVDVAIQVKKVGEPPALTEG